MKRMKNYRKMRPWERRTSLGNHQQVAITVFEIKTIKPRGEDVKCWMWA